MCIGIGSREESGNRKIVCWWETQNVCFFYLYARMYPHIGCRTQRNEATQYGEQGMHWNARNLNIHAPAQHSALHQIHITQSLLHIVNNSNVTNINSNVPWKFFVGNFIQSIFCYNFFSSHRCVIYMWAYVCAFFSLVICIYAKSSLIVCAHRAICG